MQQNAKNLVETPLLPAVPMKNCPIESSMGVLGRKWTLLILRNIGVFKKERFNQMLDVTPGLTPRVLSMRLRELEKNGFIKHVEEHGFPKIVRWELTEKGNDTLPILVKFVEFGAKWFADRVFEDKKPRTIKQIFPQKEARRYL